MTATKLAFVYPSFNQHGGAELYLITTMNALVERGYQVDLFTAAYDQSIHPALDQVRFGVRTLGGHGFNEGLPGTLRMIWNLSRRLRGYDLVVASNFPAHIWGLGVRAVPIVWLCMEPKRNLYPDIMYAEAAGLRPSDYRTVADYKGLSGLWTLLTRDQHVLLPYNLRLVFQRALDRLAVRHVDHVFAISPYVKEKVEQIYHHPSVQNVWGGIRMDMDGTPEITYEPFVLVPTRLEPIKNVEVVLRAVRILRENGELGDYQVIITGSGTMLEDLKALTHDLGLGDVVTFAGFVNQRQRDRYYATCSLVVYPSLAESLGLPVAEAAFHEKTVIADRHGGPAAMIEHDETGLVVDMTQPPALAAAMSALIADPERARTMGQAAHRHIASFMALDPWADHFAQLIDTCLDSNRAVG